MSRRLIQGAIVATASLFLTGIQCNLLTPEPTNDTIVVCKAALLNPSAVGEGVNQVPMRMIDSDTDPFRVPKLSVGRNCWQEGPVFTNASEIEPYWGRLVADRLAALPPEDQFGLNLFGGEWCQSPAMPIACTDTGARLGGGSCGGPRVLPEAMAADPVPLCEDPPGGDRVVSCGVPSCTAHCNELVFDPVPVGSQATTNVFVASCAGAVIDVLVDGMVINPGPDGRSEFTVGDPVDVDVASCIGEGGDEAVSVSECAFAVTFEPTLGGEHSADFGVTGGTFEAFSVRGTAVGGSAQATSAAQLPDGRLCMDTIEIDGCTVSQALAVRNVGDGVLAMDDATIDNSGFQLVAGAPSPGQPVLIEPDASVDVEVRWCAADATSFYDRNTGLLSLGFADPQIPPLALELLREPGGCAVDPALVAGYRFELNEDVDNVLAPGEDVVDVSGDPRFNGTFVDSAARTATALSDDFGRAVELTGTGGHVELGDALTVEGEQMTIALRYRAGAQVGSDPRFVARGWGLSLDQQAWVLGIEGPDQNGAFLLTFRLRTDGVTTPLLGSEVPLDGTWRHVAATYDGARMVIYDEGVEVAATAKTGTIDNLTTGQDPVSVWIGDNPVNGERAFIGEIDEVRIYQRALSAEEIAAIRNSPVTPYPRP